MTTQCVSALFMIGTFLSAGGVCAQYIAAPHEAAGVWWGDSRNVGVRKPSTGIHAAPTFSSIAGANSTVTNSIDIYPSTSHERMPNPSLSDPGRLRIHQSARLTVTIRWNRQGTPSVETNVVRPKINLRGCQDISMAKWVS